MQFDLDDLALPGRSLSEDRARVEAIAFDASGERLALAAYATLLVYELRDGHRAMEVRLSTARERAEGALAIDAVRAVRFTADGRRLVAQVATNAVPGFDTVLLVVNVASGVIERTMPDATQREALRVSGCLGASISAWALAPDGDQVAVAFAGAPSALLSLTGAQVRPVGGDGGTSAVQAVAWSARGALAVLTREGVELYDDPTEKTPSYKTKVPFGRGVFAVSDDGGRVVAAGHYRSEHGSGARCGLWTLRRSDGYHTFEAQRTTAVVPVAASLEAGTVWWARPVERFSTKLLPLDVYAQRIESGETARACSDARKATSTCVTVSRDGKWVAFGRLRNAAAVVIPAAV